MNLLHRTIALCAIIIVTVEYACAITLYVAGAYFIYSEISALLAFVCIIGMIPIAKVVVDSFLVGFVEFMDDFFGNSDSNRPSNGDEL